MSVISYQNARWHIPKGSDLNIRGCGVIRSGPMHFYPSFFKLSLFFFPSILFFFRSACDYCLIFVPLFLLFIVYGCLFRKKLRAD